MEDKQKLLFTFNAGIETKEVDGKAQHKFYGVAYSGQVIENHGWWGNLIFDLDTISQPKKPIPALAEHDVDRLVGSIESFDINHTAGLQVSGSLYPGEPDADRLIRLSQKGHEWQMSVYIQPGEIEEVKSGKTINVNSQELNGPITVFRDSTIREVSFCVLGADENTSATAFSARENAEEEERGLNMTTELKEKISILEAEKTGLQKELAEERTSRERLELEVKHFTDNKIKELFGEEITDEEMKKFEGLSMDQLELFAEKLKPVAPTPTFGQADFEHRQTEAEQADVMAAL